MSVLSNRATPQPWVVAVAALALVALGWRVLLWQLYAGWEESDYGNLAMIEGVLAGGFRHYDMNHMPGYYAVSAVLHGILGDSLLSGRLVALAGGAVAWAGAVWLAHRLAGPLAAVIAAGLLTAQPEFALYSASTLREPMYAAAVIGVLAGLCAGRPGLAGLAGAVAFSVRFDALFVLPAIVLLHVAGRRGAVKIATWSIGPVVAAAIIWSVYCRVDHGTFAFWSHAVAVNVETGLGAEQDSRLGWGVAGTGVAAQLVGWTLPWRVGWGVWASGIAAAVVVPWSRPSEARTVAGAVVVLVGFWGAVGFVGQHDPVHNLYWKWMMPLVPVVVAWGGAGIAWGSTWLAQRGRGARWLAACIVVGLLAQALASQQRETTRQLELSRTLYAPQRALGVWVETAVAPGPPLLIDNIPACWVNRRPHDHTLVSWFDVPAEGGDAFAAWVQAEGVPWVLWFREDWTQAPRVAPELSEGGVVRLGEVRFEEVAREDAYGWVLYRAAGPGIPPAGPPPDPTLPLPR